MEQSTPIEQPKKRAERATCGAKARSTGDPCRDAPARGRTRCRRHGGATPVGPLSPRWKDGRHSRWLPKRLQEKYDAATRDTTLLSLREDIALIDARLEDLIRRADTGESGKAWEQLGAIRRDLLHARQVGATASAAASLEELLNLIARGHRDAMIWAEIRRLLRDRAKLISVEVRRLQDMQQFITVENLVTVMQTLAGIIIRRVDDRRTARLVLQDIGALLGPELGNDVTPDDPQ